MFFCYITKTPWVILLNNNHKVKVWFEWIKNCGYIMLCENSDVNEIIESIEKLYNI